MEQFSPLRFLLVSIPEEFIIALFVWVILGKQEIVKFLHVVVTGVIAAISFSVLYILLFPKLDMLPLLQPITFMLIVYFTYRLNFIESVIGPLVSFVILTVLQGSIVSLIIIVSRMSYMQLINDKNLGFILGTSTLIVLGLSSLILHRNNIKLFNFKNKTLNKSSASRIRYLVLQLTFTIFITFVNYRVFFENENLLKNSFDKSLIIMNFLIIIVFTILIIKSAFSMGESIQKEEELKRKLDGREIIQNIDYICQLMDEKAYDEVKSILESIKNEVDSGIVNNSETSRGDSIK